ncbi:MAG: flagellin [Lachnospiraceae bacterium]|nr:flagellin [Lachnospiraceae bacterium]
MIVQHNLTAMNSNRMLGVNTNSQAKSSEKLSSGYKINRAADDAAGLKISEKMRSQVRGLQRASTNAQDGVSLIQTAEGALNEAHSILQRMNELAVQGANDTNQDIDREAINEELAQLTEELDRISETTQFNKQELLDGTFQNKKLHVGANTNQYIEIGITSMNAQAIGVKDSQITASGLTKVSKTAGTTSVTTYSTKVSKTVISIVNSAAGGTSFYASTIFGAGVGGALGIGATGKLSFTASGLTSIYAASGIGAVCVTKSGVKSTTGGALKVDTYSIANATLSRIQDAINKVSGQRSALGAIQNRLEHTIANLDNVAENTQAAESRIRDTDMASEMVEYSKNNILAQAGQAMLAQSNQATQGVLSLLQ